MTFSNNAKAIYFVIFAFLYFGYTVYFVGHGVHLGNSIVSIALIFLALYYYLKGRVKK